MNAALAFELPERLEATEPPPEDSVPGLLALIEGSLPSGRYRAAELAGAKR